MPEMLSTKLTKSGQTTIPAEVRKQCNIEDESRVYWVMDGDRAYISANPAMPPLVLGSEDEFWQRIKEAEADFANGNYENADVVIDRVWQTFGL